MESDIEVVNIFKNNNPPYVDIVGGGMAFTFWFEGKRLRCNKRTDSGVQNSFSVIRSEIDKAARRKAAAILKSL